MTKLDELQQAIRGVPLSERIERCTRIIGKLCSEGRGPRMSVPVQWDDDDIFITTTLTDLGTERDALAQRLAEMEWAKNNAESALYRHGYKQSCDIPACNCGDQWNHGGHAAERLREISDALPFENGKTILQRVQQLQSENARLREELAAAQGPVDPHNPTGQAIIEQWLLAAERGEARPGDCLGILQRMMQGTWTTERPTEAGWYWWRNRNAEPIYKSPPSWQEQEAPCQE